MAAMQAMCKLLKKSNPPFDPAESITFKYTMCDNEHCMIFADGLSPACDYQLRCQISFAYGDGSTVSCTMASDFFELEGRDGARKSFNRPLYFGCAFSAMGNFYEGEDGVLGLGQGPFSMIFQLGISKFSHCLQLPHTGATSYISFGDAARLVGQSAPLIQNKQFSSQYFVDFHSMIVVYNQSEIKLDVPSNVFAMDRNGQGGLMLDFGTVLTRIPRVAFDELCKVLQRVVPHSNVLSVPLDDGTPLFCFKAPLKDWEDIGLIFRLDSINIKLTGRQLFVQYYIYNNAKHILQKYECLTISITLPSLTESILGAYAQASYNIGYDLDNQTVTFEKMKC